MGRPQHFSEGQLRPRENNASCQVTQLVSNPTRIRTQVAWFPVLCFCAQAYIPPNDFANYNHTMMVRARLWTSWWCSSVLTGIYMIMSTENASRCARVSADNRGVVFKWSWQLHGLQKVGLLNQPRGNTAKGTSSVRTFPHLILISWAGRVKQSRSGDDGDHGYVCASPDPRAREYSRCGHTPWALGF